MVLKVKQLLYSGLNFVSEKMLFAQIALNRGLLNLRKEKNHTNPMKKDFLKTFTVFLNLQKLYFREYSEQILRSFNHIFLYNLNAIYNFPCITHALCFIFHYALP